MARSMVLGRAASCLALLACLAAEPVCASGMVVVVHADSAIGALSREQVARIFLGRLKRLPNGAPVTAVEVEPLRARFYPRLIGRDVAEVNAYWARLQFSGRTQPPQRLASSSDALAAVLADRNLVAHLEADPGDPRVRVLLRLED